MKTGKCQNNVTIPESEYRYLNAVGMLTTLICIHANDENNHTPSPLCEETIQCLYNLIYSSADETEWMPHVTVAESYLIPKWKEPLMQSALASFYGNMSVESTAYEAESEPLPF